MLIARHSVHDNEPWISPRAVGLGRRKWLIRLHAQTGQERSSDMIRNQSPCSLADILETATQSIEEMLAEHDRLVSDAGFQVFLLR